MGAKNLRPKRLAEKLKKIRSNLNLSQNDLIERMGFAGIIFQGNISQYELGRREPPLPVLLAYARLIKINVDTLIDDKLKLPGQ
ncbi:MAG TPA: helix-turn-helix transcriptional regulator [Pyrinomonadaceae bacterium]|jgi:transcriptional regulator with XRE-family HTH domain|nr:helix-turn-helix transcriptional regulator [Pyrinomonadaceae bacterium]